MLLSEGGCRFFLFFAVKPDETQEYETGSTGQKERGASNQKRTTSERRRSRAWRYLARRRNATRYLESPNLRPSFPNRDNG